MFNIGTFAALGQTVHLAMPPKRPFGPLLFLSPTEHSIFERELCGTCPPHLGKRELCSHVNDRIHVPLASATLLARSWPTLSWLRPTHLSALVEFALILANLGPISINFDQQVPRKRCRPGGTFLNHYVPNTAAVPWDPTEG